jgi:hypothetical protein
VIAAAIGIMLAQTCAGILPKPDLEIEWLRNGKAYARDVPIEATRMTRTYRRTPSTGAKSTRTLSCTNGTGGVVLTESVNSESRIRLPLALKTGQSRTMEGILVRRVRPPVNAAANAFWFLVASDAARIYGVREGVGIVELRMQSASGNVDVYRAYLRTPAPTPVVITEGQPELESEIARLQYENRALQDSVGRLVDEVRRLRGRSGEPDDGTQRDPASVGNDDVSFAGVDVYVEQGNYPAAIALLVRMQSQVIGDPGAQNGGHPSAPRIATRLGEVVRACQRANPGKLSVCAVR